MDTLRPLSELRELCKNDLPREIDQERYSSKFNKTSYYALVLEQQLDFVSCTVFTSSENSWVSAAVEKILKCSIDDEKHFCDRSMMSAIGHAKRRSFQFSVIRHLKHITHADIRNLEQQAFGNALSSALHFDKIPILLPGCPWTQ